MARGPDKKPGRDADELYRAAERYGLIESNGKPGRNPYGDVRQKLLEAGFTITQLDDGAIVVDPPPDFEETALGLMATLDLRSGNGRVAALERMIKLKLRKKIQRDDAELIVKAVNAAGKIDLEGNEDDSTQVVPIEVDSPEAAREHEKYIDDLDGDGRL